MSWANKMSELRKRIAPQLALLPEEIQSMVQRSRHYHGSRAYADPPHVHAAEQMVSDCERLVRAGAATAADVLSALEHPRPEVRETARSLVGWLGWRRAAPYLLRQFENQADERQAIGGTLAKLDSHRARRQLEKWMVSHPKAELRWQAAISLLSDGNISLVPSFLAVVNDESEADRTRRIAIEGVAVCLNGQDRRSQLWRNSTQALIPYLDHPDWEFRWEAAFALGQANAKAALPKLREMAQSDREVEKCNKRWPIAEIISWLEKR